MVSDAPDDKLPRYKVKFVFEIGKWVEIWLDENSDIDEYGFIDGYVNDFDDRSAVVNMNLVQYAFEKAEED